MAYRCSRCGALKSIDEFFRRNDRPGGRQSECKTCRLVRDRADGVRHRAAGRCSCGRPLLSGKSRCEGCVTSGRQAGARMRQRRRAEGLCWCGRPRSDGYSECDRCSAARGKRAHGAGLEERARLFSEQGGLCALCGGALTGFVRKAHAVVDHDHETSRIRGLLHDRCNLLVSNLDLARAQRLVAYLEQGGQCQHGRGV